MARQEGMNAEELAKDVLLRVIEDDERYRAAVREGIAAADRGEFVAHEEVWANIEKILRS